MLFVTNRVQAQLRSSGLLHLAVRINPRLTMFRQTWFSLAAAGVSAAASLSDVCTTSHVQSSIPADAVFPGLTFRPDAATVNVAYNQTYSSSDYPTAAISYCNVTFQYRHNGWDDNVIVQYWLPDPAAYQSRFLATRAGG